MIWQGTVYRCASPHKRKIEVNINGIHRAHWVLRAYFNAARSSKLVFQ